MKKFTLLLLSFFLIGQNYIFAQDPAPIKTVTEPDGTVDFSFTNSPVGAPFRFINPFVASFFPYYHLPTWGVTNQFTNVMTLTPSPIGDFAITQSYQKHIGDTISVVQAGSGLFPINYTIGTQNPDGSVDSIRNLYHWANPDNHGLAIKNGKVYYCQNINDTIIINDGINDGSYTAIGTDLKRVSLASGTVVTLFDWFDEVPITMYVPEYWHEMMTGAGLDWPHFNWISFDNDGHLLISYRTMGFKKVNINTGEVIWWGGLPADVIAAAGFTPLNCVSGDCRTRLQHNIKAFPNKPGWYTVFDNGDNDRINSRGLVFSVDGLDMTVEEEYIGVPSPFQGSVDIWEEDTTYLLLNIPTIGEDDWLDSLPSWIADTTVTENLESRLTISGSIVRLYDRMSGEILGEWRTDSLNFIYAAELCDVNLVPSATGDVIRNDFSLFPNPITDYLMVPLGNYAIFNMNAKLVGRGTGTRVDVKGLAPGQYVIQEEDGSKAFFIKQ